MAIEEPAAALVGDSVAMEEEKGCSDRANATRDAGDTTAAETAEARDGDDNGGGAMCVEGEKLRSAGEVGAATATAVAATLPPTIKEEGVRAAPAVCCCC